jgi:hypothetical protein
MAQFRITGIAEVEFEIIVEATSRTAAINAVTNYSFSRIFFDGEVPDSRASHYIAGVRPF